MAEIDLEQLTELEAKATPTPWIVEPFDDEYSMTAIGVRALLPDEHGHMMNERIAATLIQQPNYVGPSDEREMANAELIAEVRNALPELLRLARVGLAMERPDA